MFKRVLTVLLVSLAAGAVWSVAARADFPDVPWDHWAYDAVAFLEEEGLVIGEPDGNYYGDRQLSRYEFAMAVSRLYDQFMMMVEEMEAPPPIEVEAVLDMLMDEFQPEIDELMELMEANAERMDALEETVGGFDERINEVHERVDGMDARFHPFGDLRLRFEGIYPDDGMETQRPRYMLHWGFTSEITDELTLGARFASGHTGEARCAFETVDDAFVTDDLAIDRAYLQWQPADYPCFTMWGGKFSPPWVTTVMVWDSDVQVEGLAQHYYWNDFNFYLGELVPAEAGFYIVAQAGVDDLLIDGFNTYVTYHYINSDAWTHIRQDMQAGNLVSNWNFARLESPDDYRAIEWYGEFNYDLGNIPFKLQGNYLHNLEDTAPGLPDEAGWQRAAWARLTVFNKPKEPGDWNVWGEWGRFQPNSVLTWTSDAARKGGDCEFWAVGWTYRLMRNTDFAVTYFDINRLSVDEPIEQKIHVDVMTKF